MKVDLYERIWLWLATAMIVGFLTTMVLAASFQAIQPPSHVEVIDPLRVKIDSDFATPRVELRGEHTYVIGIAEMFRFLPAEMRVPAGLPVTFRLTSPDVMHGFQVVGTNANAMIAPGYVTQFTTTFPKAGEYLIVCNEFCGLSHHQMQGKLIVEEPNGAGQAGLERPQGTSAGPSGERTHNGSSAAP